jgi:uncharacterized protein YjcR
MNEKTKLKGEAFAMFIKGINQKDIAKELGLSERTLTNWQKNGKWKLLKDDELVEASKEIAHILLELKDTNPELGERLMKPILILDRAIAKAGLFNIEKVTE